MLQVNLGGVVTIFRILMITKWWGGGEIFTMSADKEASEAEGRNAYCAACGIAEIDNIVLNECNHCKSVRYCGVKCQKEHRPWHKEECKKRAAELRDELLFKQPESSCYGDCPICCLPLSLDTRKATLFSCCSKVICDGCDYANQIREFEGSLQPKCLFCRLPRTSLSQKIELNLMRRVEAEDPVARSQMGEIHYDKGDYDEAFQCWEKAAEMGNALAHFSLCNMYREGKGVKKDEKKMVYHLEQAAIAGVPDARYNLGLVEEEHGRMDRAVQHWIIAANQGHDHSLRTLKDCYREGSVNKEDFAAALRAHQAAVDATKSPQREAIDVFICKKWGSRQAFFRRGGLKC